MKEKIYVGFSHQFLSKDAQKNFECNRLTLINKGTQNVIIDGQFTLVPNDSISYPPDFPNEVNNTVYNIKFTNDQLPGCLLVAVVKNILKVDPGAAK